MLFRFHILCSKVSEDDKKETLESSNEEKPWLLRELGAGVSPVLPLRTSYCYLSRPETRVTSQSGNKIRCRQGEEKLENPREGLLLSPLHLTDTTKRFALRKKGLH